MEIDLTLLANRRGGPQTDIRARWPIRSAWTNPMSMEVERDPLRPNGQSSTNCASGATLINGGIASRPRVVWEPSAPRSLNNRVSGIPEDVTKPCAKHLGGGKAGTWSRGYSTYLMFQARHSHVVFGGRGEVGSLIREGISRSRSRPRRRNDSGTKL